MRIADCNLDIKVIMLHPPVVTRPAEEWSRAYEEHAIPESLYRLYRVANFLSFGTAPGFLADDRNILFGYFGTLMRGLRELCIEAKDELSYLDNEAKEFFNPQKGKPLNKKADREARRHLKHFLIAISAILDTCAELVALFFPGEIRGLSVGRADFESIEKWLGTTADRPTEAVLSPKQHFLAELQHRLSSLVRPEGPDREWLCLVRLLRNKLAHTGHPIFFAGLHDHAGEFFTFLPRRWPYIKEEFLAAGPTDDVPTLGEYYKQSLMQEDFLSFGRGLYSRTRQVLDQTTDVLSDAFEQLKTLPVNEAAIRDLQRNTKQCEFEYFPTEK
jgi:hypothetical protein